MVDIAICIKNDVSLEKATTVDLTDRIDVETVGFLHAEQARFHRESDVCSSGASHVIRPFALLLLVVPEQLMRTLAHVVRARLANMIDIAVLFVRV